MNPACREAFEKWFPSEAANGGSLRRREAEIDFSGGYQAHASLPELVEVLEVAELTIKNAASWIESMPESEEARLASALKAYEERMGGK